MPIARLLQLIATIAGLVAVALGMATFTHPTFTSIHMLFGLVVTVSLLVLAVMAVSTSALRRLGAIGIVYAIILPVFGVTQERLLVGDWHWLIQTAHLLVSGGALAYIGALSAGLLRLKRGKPGMADLARQPQAAQ